MFGKKPECSVCHVTEASRWNKLSNGDVVCNNCLSSKNLSSNAQEEADKDQENPENFGFQPQIKLERISGTDLSGGDSVASSKVIKDKEMITELFDSGSSPKQSKEKGKKEDNDEKEDGKRETRRKTRKGKTGIKGSVPKGKGRRYIFKKSSTKSPLPVSIPVTSESLMYKGQYYQIGDIVSVQDIDGGKFYCQIRGLLQDQYCEKSAVITWLLPTTYSPPPEQKFDPATYIIGPEEELPRKLEYFEFVCHAPSDYYKNSSAPYSTFPSNPQSCFVWSRMGPPPNTAL